MGKFYPNLYIAKEIGEFYEMFDVKTLI